MISGERRLEIKENVRQWSDIYSNDEVMERAIEEYDDCEERMYAVMMWVWYNA